MPKCECPDAQFTPSMWYGWYEDEERKAMNHKPNECPGDYELAQYKRDGQILWLCSACTQSRDEMVDE